MKRLKNKIKSLANKLPYVRVLYKEQMHYKKNACYPPGHYYSPIVLVDDIKGRESDIWDNVKIDGIPGIDLNTAYQLDLVEKLSKYY